MPRTKHAVVIVVVVLLALLGLFVAITVFAPERTDDLILPAAVFSSMTTLGAHAVVVLDSGDAAGARATLIEKIGRGEGVGSDVKEEYLHGTPVPAPTPTPTPTPTPVPPLAPAFFSTSETASSSTHVGAEPVFSTQTAHAAEVETNGGATTTETINE